MTHFKRLLRNAIFTAFSCAAGLSAASAQDVKWAIPPEKIGIDYGSPQLKYQDAFLDVGLSREVAVGFTLIGRKKVLVEAKLPEPGQFTIQLVSEGTEVELKQIDEKSIEVTSKYEVLSPAMVRAQAHQKAMDSLPKQLAQARGEAGKKKKAELESYLRKHDRKPPDDDDDVRKAYIDRRAIELGESIVRDELAAFAKQRPEWASKSDQDGWKQLADEQLFDAWTDLLSVQIAYDYLKENGYTIDLMRINSAATIRDKFLGVHALLSGLLSKEPTKDNAADREAGQKGVRALAPEEAARLRKGLIVKVMCRHTPQVDEADANSQWFHSQRIICQARGIGTVKVSGKLDPGQHDRVDWWTLVGYDAANTVVQFGKEVGVKHEILSDKDVARLRIVAAGDQPAAYAFEVRGLAPTTGARTIVIQESASVASEPFPF